MRSGSFHGPERSFQNSQQLTGNIKQQAYLSGQQHFQNQQQQVQLSN